MAKTKQSNLIASVKMQKHRCHQQRYYKVRNRWEGRSYSVLVNNQSFLSNFFSLAPSQVFFFVNCRRNGLLHVSFIEQYDFMIYQHLNFTISHLPNSSFMQPVYLYLHCQFLCHVKALFFYQNSPKIKLFLQKNANFCALGALPQCLWWLGASPPDSH